jgi:hypothetical protein
MTSHLPGRRKWLIGALGGSLVAASALLLTGFSTEGAGSRCSVRLLTGAYGGSFDAVTPGGALRGLVVTRFDGRGKLTQSEFTTLNGVPTSTEWRAAVGGTYHIDSDCTGAAEVVQANGQVIRQQWVVVDRGREIRAVVEGAQAGGVRRKIH